jgi:putative endonuclease
MARDYYIYVMTNRTRMLYVGVTNDLHRRVDEHRRGVNSGFTSKYKMNRLVYFEHFKYINDAIAREKEIKGWVRRKKIALIEAENPKWSDLWLELFAEDENQDR